jgi:hypothetical protein
MGMTFFNNKIDEYILNRVRKEVQYRGSSFFLSKSYNQIDVVCGGNHGARHFRAVI